MSVDGGHGGGTHGAAETYLRRMEFPAPRRWLLVLVVAASRAATHTRLHPSPRRGAAARRGCGRRRLLVPRRRRRRVRLHRLRQRVLRLAAGARAAAGEGGHPRPTRPLLPGGQGPAAALRRRGAGSRGALASGDFGVDSGGKWCEIFDCGGLLQAGDVAFEVPMSLVVTLERVLGDESVGECSCDLF